MNNSHSLAVVCPKTENRSILHFCAIFLNLRSSLRYTSMLMALCIAGSITSFAQAPARAKRIDTEIPIVEERPERVIVRPTKKVAVDFQSVEEIETLEPRSPIAFQPFPLIDPATGNAVSPDALITLPSGKQVSAGAYYEELNSIERKMNEKGYTLREASSFGTHIKSSADMPRIQAQARALHAEHIPEGPVRMRAVEELDAEHSTRIGEDYIRNIKLADYTLKAESQAPMMFMMRRDDNGDPYPGPDIDPNPTPTPTPTTPTSAKIVKPINYQVGDAKIFAAFLAGKIELFGSRSNANLVGDLTAGAKVLKQKLNIVHANGSLTTTNSGANMKVDIEAEVLDDPVYSFNETINTSWSKTDNITLGTLDVSKSGNFNVGPVPVTVKIGVKGSAQLGYWVGLRALSASGKVTPKANVSAYGQLGVGTSGLSAGVGGKVDIVKGKSDLFGQVALEFDGASKPFIHQRYYLYNDWKMLSGNIYAYAEVCLPIVGCWKPTKDIWDWEGITLRGFTFNIDRKTYIK